MVADMPQFGEAVGEVTKAMFRQLQSYYKQQSLYFAVKQWSTVGGNISKTHLGHLKLTHLKYVSK